MQTFDTRAKNAGRDQTHANAVATAFGYKAEDLKALPAVANLGLSCGNPLVRAANIKEGQRVLDLGSGGGIDVLLAASKVGPSGQLIGLDASPNMIDLARRNAYSKGFKPPYVSFVLASLEKDLPIESSSIDWVISNCVINHLSSDGKWALFKEVTRVLKPGGRVIVDDVMARDPEMFDDFPGLRTDLSAYLSSTAEQFADPEEYIPFLGAAGFKDLELAHKDADLNVYLRDNQSSNASDVDVNDLLVSFQVSGLKPNGNSFGTAGLETALKRSWDAYPEVKSTPPPLTNDDVAKMMLETPADKRDFVVIDVRRNDHGGGHVRDSEQWAAQTFYDHRSELFEKHKDKKSVIFYCGSSNGRGPRCTGWYQDYLDDRGEGATGTKAYVLQGGIKAWLAKF
ncbi:arsenite S-adenosylmethyltransferase [Coprinopsis sp. MPI-PUGE-AT-0042]|nr:arsenite S-adenosylmethyltransferase [Coprinopsis sp. MPI-PUGE-AT-0042]